MTGGEWGYNAVLWRAKFKLKQAEVASVRFRFTMASFRDARNLLTAALCDDLISEDEYLLLYDLNRSKNLDLPYDEFTFDLDDMENSECVAEFRVNKHDLPALAEALQIPDVFKCRQRSISDGMEGLCMLLRRLAYPCRYSDMIARFGRPTPVLSMITNEVIDYIYNNHSHRIMQWNPTILQPAQLQEYANAIHVKGAALDNCFGFIDGTVRPISRPGEHQRIVYNGHKRVHGLKCQSVALPNGLIANMYGPVGEYLVLIRFIIKEKLHFPQKLPIGELLYEPRFDFRR